MDTWTLQTDYPAGHVLRDYEKNSVTFKHECFLLVEHSKMNATKVNPLHCLHVLVFFRLGLWFT